MTSGTSVRAPWRALSALRRPWPAWRPVWERRERLGGELVTVVGFLAIALVNGVGYPLLARVMQAHGVTVWDPTTALDAWIPALPWTVLLYSTMYLYYPVGVGCAPRSDEGRTELCLHVQGQLLLALISYAVFVLLPAEIHLNAVMQEQLAHEPAWLQRIYEALYAVDRPWNAWPSLHVSQSLFVLLCVLRWMQLDLPGRRPWLPRGRARRILVPALWIAWCAMALSILTTKQHFVWDGLTGALLALGIWRFYFLPGAEAARVTGST
jgi:hypothetical protein